MKKSVLAIAVAIASVMMFLPAVSGCSADIGYELKTAEDGSKYYSARATGFSSGLTGEFEIPAYYGEGEERYPVKEIAEQGFTNTAISKLIIPATVEKVGTAAFIFNANLAEVEFKEGSALKSLGWGAFGGCTRLKKVTLPQSLVSIEGRAFYQCEALTDITLPQTLQNIDMYAFYGCSSLDRIVLPSSLVSIGNVCFYGCSSLSGIILPDGMHSVTSPVLDENGEPEYDKNGSPVTQTTPAIGIGAFYACSSLKLAVVGAGITEITEGAFGGCTALEEIYLPAGLKAVKGIYYGTDGEPAYMYPFAMAQSLKKVYFGGTAEEWAALSDNSDHTVYYADKQPIDNSYLFNAEIIYQTTYKA